MTQGIRPSQFVTTYGPGAILEGKNGPRIILEAGLGLFGHGSARNPDDYRIDDMRMSRGLLKGDHIYRLPTNAEEGIGDSAFLYKTNAFSRWKVCHTPHGSNGSLLYEQGSCPVHKNGGERHAVGFVAACRDGHLDDVPWDLLVHHFSRCEGTSSAKARPGPYGGSIFWQRRGLALSSVMLRCPRCDRQRSFGSVYYGEGIKCRGRHPQSELPGHISAGPCGQKARVVNRQAANLHLPETRTLLSVRSTYTELHQSLQDRAVRMAFVGRSMGSKGDLLDILDDPTSRELIRPAAADALRRAEWGEIQQAIEDSRRGTPDSYHGLVMDEFDGLLEASVGGAPPRDGPDVRSRALFELDPDSVVQANAANGRQFLVAPVQTLRAVTVQIGFRRDIPAAAGGASLPEIVPSVYRKPNDDQGWYPGVELYGEGLFIRLKNDGGWAPNPAGGHAKLWMDALEKAESYPHFPFRDPERSREELHPGFVWWHTLAHLLVRSISEDAGYSSSAIRERVYFKSKNGKSSGGILLYATQPGSDGTLGGLIALAPYMDRILRATLDRAAACSGDPLCIDNNLAPGGYNGASCYACSMNSETSCEHRNMWLDRGVLLDNLP